MLTYRNTFENIKTINCNFPIEDQFYVNDNGDEAIVADGITRDQVGISDFNLISFEEFIKKYPRPSGGEIAAKTIVDTFKNSKGTLKNRLIECNNEVRKINAKYIKKCDYLENDYYGAVASCVKLESNTLHYAFICDCGVIIYDKFGNIKFKTADEKELLSDPYINKIGIPWNLKEARIIVRRDYRNNPNNIKDNKCVSYGALTGEEEAINFIRTGKVKLSPSDIVVLYSDGFVNFLDDKKFINLLLNFDKEHVEKYVHEKAEKCYDKYGKEKTIIVLKDVIKC